MTNEDKTTEKRLAALAVARQHWWHQADPMTSGNTYLGAQAQRLLRKMLKKGPVSMDSIRARGKTRTYNRMVTLGLVERVLIQDDFGTFEMVRLTEKGRDYVQAHVVGGS